MNLLERIKDSFPDQQFSIVNGYDDAIIGVSQDFSLVYSVKTTLDIILKENSLNTDEALEHFYFNVFEVPTGFKVIWCYDQL